MKNKKSDVNVNKAPKYRKFRAFGMEIYVLELISIIGLILSVAALAFLLPVSGSAALICVLFTYIFRGLWGTNIGLRGVKCYIPCMIPIVIVFILSMVLSRIELTDQWPDLVEIAARIAAFVFLVPFMINKAFKDFCFTYEIPHRLVEVKVISPQQFLISNIFKWAHRILILVGCACSIFLGFPFSFVAIVGVVLWAVYIIMYKKFYQPYYDLHIEEKESLELCREDYSEDYAEQSPSEPKKSWENRDFNSHDVEVTVKKIADRWSYKEYVPFAISGGGTIQYQVRGEVVGYNMIVYTVDGKMRGFADDKYDEAYVCFKSKMRDVEYEIGKETRDELGKHSLPYSSYEITVRMGRLY